jgi:hypothetical protein
MVAAGAALLGAGCQSGASVAPPYGLPPHFDAGTDSDSVHDAGEPPDAPPDSNDAAK